VKNTFPLDLTIPNTSVCSRDSETADSNVTRGSSTWLDEGSLDAGGSETVTVGLLLGLGGGVNARRLAEPLTSVEGLRGLGPGGFIHSCASARL